MITVIIAGGSGTRLWPLSTATYPKHLLKLINDRTLLQGAYDRARKLGETVYVVTEAGHAHYVREQLPELSEQAFLIEPARRGTAHCILLALDYIRRHHSANESIAFIHSDHHIQDVEGFVNSFRAAAETSAKREKISLIGIEPTYPATGFGYIERDDSFGEGVFLVKSFKEKPDLETATRYIDSQQYLWNAGYFVGSVKVFLQEIRDRAPNLEASYDKLTKVSDWGSNKYKQAYLSLDSQVIDIALIEKAKDLLVVAASFDWADVGSFKDLHNSVLQDEHRNCQRGENIHTLDVEDAYICNQEDKPLAVIGLENVVVVNTSEGILVTRKDVSHRAGEVAKKLHFGN